MRGLLTIASQRAPYLRAGLGWSERKPIELYIRELDGPRLLELVSDPVLSVSLEAADGKVTQLRYEAGETAGVYADLIGSFPELPVESVAAEPDLVADALHEVTSKLSLAGFASIDDLIQAHAQVVARSQAQAERILALADTVGARDMEIRALKVTATEKPAAKAPKTPKGLAAPDSPST